MTIAAGTRFGPYEIVAPIGAGGMGEVYRARDPRLSRDVAIKTLPAAATTDPERRIRFEREARAIAALNHPNIVTIHGLEEAEGIPFFTMEYVGGRTLTQMLSPRGLPLDEVLRIAIPLADAVGAAHEHGILHRDLKPANVMVTAEGRVKVLDFGLAKLSEAVLSEDEGAEATAATTGEGRILGTAAYMSPEQAEGKALDQRSDIFSLGILLYEMATGQRPFKGDSSVSVLSAILRDTPGSVTDLRPDLPRELARIIKRALAKDPERRYQTAKDLRNDLQTLKEDLDSGELARGGVPPVRLGTLARHPRMAMGAVLGAVVLVAVGAWWGSRLLAPTEPVSPAAQPFGEYTLRQLTTEPISDQAVAVSPDGRYVAYAFVEAGRQGLRVRQVETSATVQVVPPDDVWYNGVAFTPDGNRLYYSAYPGGGTSLATLYEVSVLGGTPRRLVEDVDSAVTFSPDAARFAFMRGLPTVGVALVIANADGTGERVLIIRQFIISTCAWSPDGRTIAAAAYDQGPRIAILAVDTATGAVTRIGAKQWEEVESLAWERDGRALIVAATDRAVADAMQVWEFTVPDGSARRITADIAGYRRVVFTADGRTLVALRSEWRGTLWAGPSAQLDRVERIASVSDRVSSRCRIGWTQDGRILHTATVRGNPDVWAVRPDGSDLRQLTTSPASDRAAVAAPDGRYIVFLSDRDGRDRVWRMEPDGGRQMPLTEGPEDHHPVVAGDSRFVYFARWEQESGPPATVHMVPIDGGQSVPATAGVWAGVGAGFWPVAVSPDGTRIFGTSWNEGQGGVRVEIVPTVGQGAVRKVAMTLAYGTERMLSWAPDGRGITFARTTDGMSNLWRQPLEGGPAIRLTNYTSGEEIVSHAWSRDGKWFALVRGAAENGVVMLRDVGRRK